jgi:hypothetical protein
MKKAAGIFALRPPGSKYVGIEKDRSASPGIHIMSRVRARVESELNVPIKEQGNCCMTATPQLGMIVVANDSQISAIGRFVAPPFGRAGSCRPA